MPAHPPTHPNTRPHAQGLKIDYVCCTPALLPLVRSCEVLGTDALPPKWSDHTGGWGGCVLGGRGGLGQPARRRSHALTDPQMQHATTHTPTLPSVIGGALFTEPAVSSGGGGVVVVRDVDFASTASADLAPFRGVLHVAYVPAGGVVLGLSKAG